MRVISDPDLQQALLDGQSYDVTVTVTPAGGSAVVVDLDHIAENGISINPSGVSGNRLEIGSVIAATGDFTFFNHDGSLDGIVFKGADISVQGSIDIGGVTKTFDIGHFVADKASVDGVRIRVECFDYMIKFDTLIPDGYLTTATTAGQLATACCVFCGVTNARDFSSAADIPNYDYPIPKNTVPRGQTYRQVLAWLAQIMGRCAVITNEGKLDLVWYSAAAWGADTENRYEGGATAENAVTLTGVRIVTSGVPGETAGSDGYTLDIADNPLLTDYRQAVVNAIWADVGAFSYYPARCDVVHNALATPFDVIDWTQEDGTVKSVAVTDVIYNLSARTQIQSKGLSEDEAGYAPQSAFTPEQEAQVRDANRLKIGRIESADGNIYFDLDTGEISTEMSEERIISSSATATYTTELDFADGFLTVTIKKNGTEIGKTQIGVNGINVYTDESQTPSFEKPAGWDNWSQVTRAAWWVAHSAISLMTAQDTINNSLTVTNKSAPAGHHQETNVTSQAVQVSDIQPSDGIGNRSILTPYGLQALDLAASSQDPDWTKTGSYYSHNYAYVHGPVVVLGPIKVGGSFYQDPDAIPVATEQYVKNYISGLLGDYVEDEYVDGVWSVRKWNSGKVECWCESALSVAAGGMTATGQSFYIDGSEAFPAGLLLSLKNLFVSAGRVSSSSQYLFWTARHDNSTTSTAHYSIMRTTQNPANRTYYVNLYAVGTWK